MHRTTPKARGSSTRASPSTWGCRHPTRHAGTTPTDAVFALFDRALSPAGPGDWPFDVAWVALYYGERLRRRRATEEAREQPVKASEAFNKLGAEPWAARAAAELRAGGHPAAATAQPGKGTLTAQEWEVARPAVTGRTNKQIAERLFLPPDHRHPLVPDLSQTRRRLPSRAV
ncbi:LuxR C-terminal-related transcriptional regulator [Streptomyces mirabilis]|uniref:LuxR C-terminal-related transcriptional regulator n=1 Tax=Streptomyces mirabilis TaxID=68239 RepID=UPI003698E1BF